MKYQSPILATIGIPAEELIQGGLHQVAGDPDITTFRSRMLASELEHE